MQGSSPRASGSASGEKKSCVVSLVGGGNMIKMILFGMGLLGLGAWFGIMMNVSGKVENGGLLRPPVRSKRLPDDDLEAIAAARALDEEIHDPSRIRWSDWSANGKFLKPETKALEFYVEGYPQTQPLNEILKAWNPDNVTIPIPFRETLQIFNYSNLKERALAEEYRNAEVPFKLYDIPNIEQVRKKWNDAYLVDVMDHRRGTQFKIERSKNNHFMYWQHKQNMPAKYKDWIPPTEIITGVHFAQWLDWAHTADAEQIESEATHHYLMLGTMPLTQLHASHSSFRPRENNKYRHFVNNDLSIFTPDTENFFITNIAANKGIQCRFGMRGVIAEAHYDGGRNMVAMLKGAKRYILSPPTSCSNLKIIPDRRHPSFRHSTTDWSHQNQADTQLNQAHAIDTVLREGEILYIPSYWIHYIVSLRYSIQCNTRSGTSSLKCLFLILFYRLTTKWPR
uniref:JmjC domain-containing protein n=1 Tax=Aureoumbra lagunensis TaxID=44058 RepID=A0A7S3NET5_9STRA